ncbi:WD repeat-containing protein 75 isoform X2 [Latimeria chalumnae]|uniref:WD repeat-containing protein 75 isoform X2 n=1 Tax=Latimeria chalumnae TaxID=7897 RepID=UPI0003C19078|nr:PREDICTED: WD repeat-containing protein 75 isoform X2 [Latimeria chalumnae]|eukprot:XP_005996584.1 PREDICTED: WD repeat-containing protein 75 isoform X2 [Latimeria chalumnae]
MEEQQPGIRVVHCSGSKINYRRAVFSIDSKYLLCASGDLVKVYSTATEESVHLLQGHKDLVTGILLNPRNHLQLYSSSSDSTIKLWDFTDGILIKTFLVGYTLYAIYTSSADENSIFAIVPKDNSEAADVFQLVSVKLPKSSEQEVEAKVISVVLDDIRQSPKSTAFGREGEYVASVKGLHLSVYYFKKKKTYRFPLSVKDKKGANNTFTCVACHPKEDCIATGHKDGKIRLWRSFNHKKEYTYASFHWHHDAVNDLIFSTEEIVIIRSNLSVSAIIQGLVKGEAIQTDLLIDPRSKALVLNGKPGHLQFYALQNDKQMYNLDIVQQEYIHQSGLNHFELVKAAFNTHGTWLATVEERQDKETELEMQMKLWAYDEETQSFTLNTTINMPHEDRITALCFYSADVSESGTPMLVTASKDGRFKAWALVDDSDIYRQSVCWSCDFVGSYHNHQATNCCCSEDGSLLAVSFEQIVTIWEANSWELKCTFCQPPGQIRDLCFGRGSCSAYLLGTTDNGFLCCWNLLSCTLEWSAQLNAILLQVDPLSENVAAFSWQSAYSDLFVFKPNEPRPLYTQKNLCIGRVQRAVFAPRDVPEAHASESHQWLDRSQLYFLTESQDLLTFSTKVPEGRLTSSSKQLVVEENVPMTPFHLLLGKQRQKQDAELGRTSAQTQLPEGSVAIKELLHTPAHVLPSASFLCSMFINSLLITKGSTSVEEAEVEMESEKEEEDSDVEISSQEKEQEVNLTKDLIPTLSKSEEKQLKKIRKTDYSWLLIA